MSSFRAIDEVASALRSATGNDMSFRAVSTRVLLRTGVNLREPRPDQVKDSASIGKVMTALGEMGFKL